MSTASPLSLTAIAFAACIALAPATAARAQESPSEILRFLLTNRSVPTGDFERDERATEETRETISQLLLVELTTLPIASGSPGFSYRFDRSLGTVGRTTESFGAFFVERSLTAGRKRASVGVDVRLSRFTTLDGFDLRDGRFTTTANRFVGETQAFDVETLELEIESKTVTAFGTYGVTDWLDVSIAVPFVDLQIGGHRVNQYYDQTLVQASANATARGLGDSAVRAKLHLKGGATGVAVAGEFLLPTGRRDDLLGAGGSSIGGLAIASIERGAISGHVNGGFTLGPLADQLHWRGAVTASLSPTFTAVGELVGRRIFGVGGLDYTASPHPSIAGVETIRLSSVGTSLHAATAIGGFKWNVTGTWLVSARVAIALDRSGLRAPVTTIVGLDYAFEY
jgi:hypothetical protein